MCGIAGILRTGDRPIDPQRVKPMCDAIAHRGPDDAGYAFFRRGTGREGNYWVGFADDEFRHLNEHLPTLGSEYARRELPRYPFDLALGHRRLAILDLTPYGHQPMSNADRRFWIVFNGEIYNFRELRDELVAKGHVFRTRTDTEVILQLWQEEGPDALERLDGMFALALLDQVAGRLYLARDRFGVKPLYTAATRDALLFASEPKAVLASGLLEPRLDPAVLAEYMTFQNVFGENVLFEGVRLLPPGECLELEVGGARPARRRFAFHRGFPQAESGLDKLELVSDQVADGFSQAVQRQLVSDVPVGAYLSGGMDSGSIVAVAGRTFPRLATFTGGFDLTNVSGIEQGFDERPMAEQLSHLLQTEHYDVVLHAGDMPAAMEKLTWHVDDPRLGMCHQNWYVAKLASRFVKVCLAGAGGDELFGGYPWRYRHGISTPGFAEFDDHQFAYWHRLLPADEMRAFLSPDLGSALSGVRNAFDAVLDRAPAWDPSLDAPSNLLQRALFFEFRTFMRGFLIIEDRLSMAHSMESRVPFLDNALTDLAFRIPPRLKVNLEAITADDSVHLETAEGKRVLRKAMERFLPAEFTRQKKQGFSPPDENWYRGRSMGYVQEILLDERTLGRPWFDAGAVRRTLDEHFRGERNHRLLIWSLLSLEWLQRHYVDVAPSRAPVPS